MSGFALDDAVLVLDGTCLRGHLVVEDGRIARLGAGPSGSAHAIACDGDLVIPGLIELHTDNLERHIEPRPGVDWPHAAAILAHDGELASTGITTVFDALRVGSMPSAGRRGQVEYARGVADEILTLRAEEALRISHFLHLRAEICSETLLGEMAAFGPDDRIGIVSLMDHTPGQRQFRDTARLRIYWERKGSLTEPEFDAQIDRLRALRDRLGAGHEAGAVAAAGRYGAILASHDDTTAAHVETSRGHGVRLAEFPTTVEAAAACRDAGIAVMMGAPNLIRGGSHSGNVAAADLARAGLLDILSSDYVPASLLAGALALGRLWDDLPRGIAAVTAAPARAAGLADRGRLEEGLRADLVRLRPRGAVPGIRGVWSDGRQVG